MGVGFGEGGGQDGCELNKELKFLGKFKKKILVGGSGGGGGGRVGGGVNGNKELEFLGKFTKIIRGGGVGLVGVRWGSGWWGVRVDVNAMLGWG